MSKDYIIEVDHLGKTFRLPKEHAGELKQHVINFLHGEKGYTDLEVLRDVSFKVEKGDFFGIVGRNGSGKSTLLKLLAGIYVPTRGQVVTRGTIVPFIELGVGFNPELTGRENIYMNGAMLGFSNEEIDKMYDDIVDFAELHEFMGQKLKNYSSGMQVRLAFSIAIKAQGDILILDEVLAVGDEAFQRKCDEFFAKIKQDKTKTVILVTHSMANVRRYCNRAIFIEEGTVIGDGDPNDIADGYSEMFLEQISPEKSGKDRQKRLGTGEIRFENIKHKLTRDMLTVSFDIKNNTSQDFDDITMGFDFMVNKEIIAGFDTRFTKDFAKISLQGKRTKHFVMNFANTFGNHDWELAMNMTTRFGGNVVDHIKPALNFRSNNIKYHPVFKVLNVPDIKISEK